MSSKRSDITNNFTQHTRTSRYPNSFEGVDVDNDAGRDDDSGAAEDDNDNTDGFDAIDFSNVDFNQSFSIDSGNANRNKYLRNEIIQVRKAIKDHIVIVICQIQAEDWFKRVYGCTFCQTRSKHRSQAHCYPSSFFSVD